MARRRKVRFSGRFYLTMLVLLGAVLVRKKRRKKAKAEQAPNENEPADENQTENT